jgi:flagellar biosynthesis GTPase FlhF
MSELINIDRSNALEVFTNQTQLTTLLAKISNEYGSLVPDLSSAKGRKDIASLAYKIAQSKSYLENIGKDLAAEYKEIPKKIDAGRKYARDFLDNLKDKIRKPLDEWEAAEAIRIEKLEIEQAIIQCWDEAHDAHERFKQELIEIEKQKRIEREAYEKRIYEEAKQRALKDAEDKQRQLEEEVRLAKEREVKAQEQAVRAQEEAIKAQELKAKQIIELQEREAEQRRKNEEHREFVKHEAISSLMLFAGLDKNLAEKVFDAIDQKYIDFISINY